MLTGGGQYGHRSSQGPLNPATGEHGPSPGVALGEDHPAAPDFCSRKLTRREKPPDQALERSQQLDQPRVPKASTWHVSSWAEGLSPSRWETSIHPPHIRITQALPHTLQIPGPCSDLLPQAWEGVQVFPGFWLLAHA